MPKSKYQPTPETRRQVKTLAGLGLRHEQICLSIGLRSPKTLRRNYSRELVLGIAESSTRIRQTAYRLATSGRDPAMTIFFLKTRAGWSPDMNTKRKEELEEQVVYIYGDYKLAPAEPPSEKTVLGVD